MLPRRRARQQQRLVSGFILTDGQVWGGRGQGERRGMGGGGPWRWHARVAWMNGVRATLCLRSDRIASGRSPRSQPKSLRCNRAQHVHSKIRRVASMSTCACVNVCSLWVCVCVIACMPCVCAYTSTDAGDLPLSTCVRCAGVIPASSTARTAQRAPPTAATLTHSYHPPHYTPAHST